MTGIYIYDGNASINAKMLKPSNRGEIEITDLNMAYVKGRNAKIEIIGSDCMWLDTGTPDSLQEASIFVKEHQNSTGKKVACLEEIAYKNGFIDSRGLIRSVERYPAGNLYGDYIRSLLD